MVKVTVKEKIKVQNSVTLSEKILKPLLDIVYQYKTSQAYNYLPRTKEDGWAYYEDKFKEIYATLDSMTDLDEETYEKTKNIITEIHSFASRCSYAEGLPERYFILNPALRYYVVAYGILKDCSIETFAECVVNGKFKYIPTYEEMQRRETYFAEREMESKELNLQHDEDDYFMEDVAKALRKAFIRDVVRS